MFPVKVAVCGNHLRLYPNSECHAGTVDAGGIELIGRMQAERSESDAVEFTLRDEDAARNDRCLMLVVLPVHLVRNAYHCLEILNILARYHHIDLVAHMYFSL